MLGNLFIQASLLRARLGYYLLAYLGVIELSKAIKLCFHGNLLIQMNH